MTALDWYFDFVSPFAYLQLQRMDAWPARVRARPVLFAALLDHVGNKGPAEIPAKRVFTYRHVQWLAEREGIALRFPPRHPFNPLRALRLAVAGGEDLDAIRAIYRFIWGEGREFESPAGWAALKERVGMPDADERIADAGVKAKLRRNGEDAIARGIFGVPTVVVDDMLFWGFDATAMVADYLRAPARFRGGELARVGGIPIGASRAG